jgi:hypothetical protein
MSAEVFPLDAIFALHRKHPDARIKHLIERIKRKKLHDALWFWWLEYQIGRIVEDDLDQALADEVARDPGFAQTAGMV